MGLIGMIIRDLLAKDEFTLYDPERVRGIVYGPDLASVVFRLSQVAFEGFRAMNMEGHVVRLKDLVDHGSVFNVDVA